MARPTKYTPETTDEIVAGIMYGLTDKDAALAAGVSEKSLERWRKRYGDFDDRLTRARAQRTRRWLRRLYELADERDVRAIESLLDRCAPEYRKRSQIDAKVTLHDLAERLAPLVETSRDELLAEAERIAAGAWEKDR